MKKQILFILLLVVIVSINSCKKDSSSSSNQSDCEKYKYGTITVSNSSSNPYDLYVNDIYTTTIAGKGITDKIQVNEGNNIKFFVQQVSGYVLYPTTKTTNINVVRCTDYTWQIP